MMSTTAPKPATTPIPGQLSAPEFEAFLLPHLSMPKRGPKGTLGYDHVFTLILWGLYTGMQWKCLPVPTDAHGTPALHLSLSRLNHWLPRGQTHPEVVEGTTEFHHEITDALLPQADAVFDDATTFHATVDVLDPQPTLVERLICHLLLQCQLLAPGFLRGHEDLHVGQRE